MIKLWKRFLLWLLSEEIDIQENYINFLISELQEVKRERDNYRDLLFKRTGLIQTEQQFVAEQTEQYIQPRMKTWHHAKRALELRARQRAAEQRVEEYKRATEGESKDVSKVGETVSVHGDAGAQSGEKLQVDGTK